MTEWLYGWAQDTVTLYKKAGWEHGPIQCLYSNQFSRRHIHPQDTIYVVHVPAGRLHLVGRIRAAPRPDHPNDVVYDPHEIDSPYHENDPKWQGAILPVPDSATAMVFDVRVPLAIGRHLRFDSRNDRFVFDDSGRIHPIAIGQHAAAGS